MLDFTFEAFRVEELVSEVVERFGELLEQAHCRMELGVDPSLTVEEGQGAAFIVRLPLRPRPPSPPGS